MSFTRQCHRPQPAIFTIEQYTNGKAEQVDTRGQEQVPDIGDGSPCTATPVASEQRDR